jgi:outer membrane protein OmpA-like peptidoglycan-associated protein
MNAAGLVVAAALALATACGSQPAAPSPAVVATAPAGASQADLDDERRGIPRTAGDDVALPFTTRTTVLADNRPATVVTLPEAVLFDFGSAELQPQAEAALGSVVELFRQQPGAEAEVAGHTDSVGSAAFNQSLSQRRATAVVDWLVAHGVSRDRLHPVGYGATRPVAGNATDDHRRRNRRVELTFS